MKTKNNTYNIELWPLALAIMVVALVFQGYSCPGQCEAPPTTEQSDLK